MSLILKLINIIVFLRVKNPLGEINQELLINCYSLRKRLKDKGNES